MQGLIFNLLEKAAHDAGCSDEAWELVVEFAAAEGLPSWGHGEREGLLDAHPPRIFEIPAEAMLRCLARERSQERRLPGWDMFELNSVHDHLPMEALRTSDAPALRSELRAPFCGGSGAFADQPRLVTTIESDLDSDEGLDKAYRVFGLGRLKQ